MTPQMRRTRLRSLIEEPPYLDEAHLSVAGGAIPVGGDGRPARFEYNEGQSEGPRPSAGLRAFRHSPRGETVSEFEQALRGTMANQLPRAEMGRSRRER